MRRWCCGRCISTTRKGSVGSGEHGFEAVAERIAEEVLVESGRYRRGWITRKSGDFGIDFVGRLDVGSGFATAKLVVLGQAKCEQTTVATSAQDLARTVARLRRGWLGVYVTTSYFSAATQREVAEDAYPLVLIHGLQVAEIVERLALAEGFPRWRPGSVTSMPDMPTGSACEVLRRSSSTTDRPGCWPTPQLCCSCRVRDARRRTIRAGALEDGGVPVDDAHHLDHLAKTLAHVTLPYLDDTPTIALQS